MSKSMVKLLPSQRMVRGGIKHPLLDKAGDPITEEKIVSLLPLAIAGDLNARQELVLGHLSMLRHLIGRYLYHWPLTRRFCDDMISVGLLSLTKAIDRLKEDTLKGKSLGQYLLNHLTKDIEGEITRLRGICPAPPATNWRRVTNGKPPIFGEVEESTSNSNFNGKYSYIEERFEEFDVLDVIATKLANASDKRAILLREEYWGMSDTEVSELTGIPRQTVQRYRKEMLRRYHEITGD